MAISSTHPHRERLTESNTHDVSAAGSSAGIMPMPHLVAHNPHNLPAAQESVAKNTFRLRRFKLCWPIATSRREMFLDGPCGHFLLSPFYLGRYSVKRDMRPGAPRSYGATTSVQYCYDSPGTVRYVHPATTITTTVRTKCSTRSNRCLSASLCWIYV